MIAEEIYYHTEGLCSICRLKVKAQIARVGDQVFLQKFCPEHGRTQALVSSDVAWYQDSQAFVKPEQRPLAFSIDTFHGCPDSCGLCPEHKQHTCLPIIEITTACDIDCPICLKDLGQPHHMTVEEFNGVLDKLFLCEGKIDVINLSGGEPTLHPRLAQFLFLADKRGVMQTSVSTNGNRFLYDKELRRLFRETSTIASLQFDGFSTSASSFLRGQDLVTHKKQIIEILEAEDIAYTLVATVAKGINDDQITDIVDFFFASQALSLMFQPATFTGQAQQLSAPSRRLTIPDVVHEIEKSRTVSPGDFNPLPCSHFSCFALSYYFHIEGGTYLSLKEFLGLEEYLSVISNRTLPGLDHQGYLAIQQKIYDFWSASDSNASNEQVIRRIQTILREMNAMSFSPKRAFSLGTAAMKSIFIHQFMDAETLDFARLIKCCNHYARADGRLMPMCSANIFYQ